MINKEWVNKKYTNRDYKGFVGDPKKYDTIGKILYTMLIENGLKKHHYFLDIGCGSLRLGKILIPYLNKNRYFGIEPNHWLVQYGINEELTVDVFEKKNPSFSKESGFNISECEKDFDFILANSIFIHAPKNDVEKCIDQALMVLKKNGVFIFSFIPGPDNNNKDWTYPGAVKYSKKYIESQLEGFQFEYINVKYPGKQVFIKVVG